MQKYDQLDDIPHKWQMQPHKSWDLFSGVFPAASTDSGLSDLESSSTSSPVLKTWWSLKLKSLMKVNMTPTAPQYRPHTSTLGSKVCNKNV